MSPRRPDALFDSGTVAVWWNTKVVFTQVRSRHYSLQQARNFVGPIMGIVRPRLGAGRYSWMSDSRVVESYEPGARGVLTNWCIAERDALERVVILISPERKLVRMGVQVAAVAAVMMGVRMHIALDPAELDSLDSSNPF